MRDTCCDSGSRDEPPILGSRRSHTDTSVVPPGTVRMLIMRGPQGQKFTLVIGHIIYSAKAARPAASSGAEHMDEPKSAWLEEASSAWSSSSTSLLLLLCNPPVAADAAASMITGIAGEALLSKAAFFEVLLLCDSPAAVGATADITAGMAAGLAEEALLSRAATLEALLLCDYPGAVGAIAGMTAGLAGKRFPVKPLF